MTHQFTLAAAAFALFTTAACADSPVTTVGELDEETDMTQLAEKTGGAFDQLDTDGSGGISFAEIQAAHPAVTAEVFAAADGDGSGDLSKDEFGALESAIAQ